MEIFTKADEEVLNEKIDDIIKDISIYKMKFADPSREEIDKWVNIVMDYIRKKKRKIYGGTAHNAAIVAKNKDDAIYDETHLPDIDFYSPDPLTDIIELTNIFFDKGYKDAHGKEAIHGATYKIYVKNENVADVSYMPSNIYNRIPFLEIDGVNYVHPSFVWIDVFRLYTDPIYSAELRWKKMISRVRTLSKYYPIPKATSPLPKTPDDSIKRSQNILDIQKTIHRYFTGKDTIFMYGRYAYNEYLIASEIKDNIYKIIDVPYYEAVSINYIDDTTDLIKLLKSTHSNDAIEIVKTEHYPFGEFWGYGTYIKYRDIVLAHIVTNNDRCVFSKSVPCYQFEKGEAIKDTSKCNIKICAYDSNFLMTLCLKMWARVNNDKETENFYNIMLSHLLTMKNYYLNKHKKTILDDTLFQELLITDCKGEVIDPRKEAAKERSKRKAEGKPAIYEYRPVNKKLSKPSDYRFPNRSGNTINNLKNFKIILDTIPNVAKPSLHSRDEAEDNE